MDHVLEACYACALPVERSLYACARGQRQVESSVCARERRWRRRGKKHERPHSLKHFAMASPSGQYIFGEFSDDEFKQFFVTARCTVELPPYNEHFFPCGPQSSGDFQDDMHLKFSEVIHGISGEDCPRIEFGIEEVIDHSTALPNNTDYSISSNLNPQAPEFILTCSSSPKTSNNVLHENNFDAINCQFSECAIPDGSGNADSDGTSGTGQRERKKKKKRPPGYYSYLEGVGDVPSETLVNGHANSTGLNSISTDDPDLAEDIPISTTSPRTCNSPDNFVDLNNEALSNDASMHNALDNARTAGQPEECSVTSSEQSCIPSDNGRESPVRTAVVQPFAGTDTTENLGVTNGQTLESSEEGTASNGVVLLPEVSSLSEEAKPEETSTAQAVVHLPGSASANPPAKSWASLFHNSKPSSTTQVAYVETKNATPVTSPQVTEKQVEIKEGPVPVSEDPVAIKIAELLEEVKLVHKPVSLQPRGLINKGNWCYINATLQALVACPPMYHLMKSIPVYTKAQRPCTSTPMIDSFVRLMNEFTNMPILPKAKQEIHINNGPDPVSEKEEINKDEQEGSDEEWEQVGPRHKSSVTRQADFVQTPITDIFGGHMRSVVYQQSSKESATLQPFFTLQLDIQSEKIRTVQDALESLVARESVQGYTTKTKQEVEICRRVTLEELPPVLVLHLKRFVFEKTGGCQKLIKNIEYPVDLEISKDLLSPGVKSKIFKGQRTYRLFAVVYHHGNSATGGHYTTDVFQIGLNGWLRIDDQTVKVINQYQVVKQTVERTAYLLYYRRVDLL
ncbi:hypothetical protein XENTR_v10011576 [Xenopus tropicalis]|nr:hypothetical protein XENTR_v10011576 [Xenopus tropicalis]